MAEKQRLDPCARNGVGGKWYIRRVLYKWYNVLPPTFHHPDQSLRGLNRAVLLHPSRGNPNHPSPTAIEDKVTTSCCLLSFCLQDSRAFTFPRFSINLVLNLACGVKFNCFVADEHPWPWRRRIPRRIVELVTTNDLPSIRGHKLTHEGCITDTALHGL